MTKSTLDTVEFDCVQNPAVMKLEQCEWEKVFHPANGSDKIQSWVDFTSKWLKQASSRKAGVGLCPRRSAPDEAEHMLPAIHAHLLALVQKGLIAQLAAIKDEDTRTRTHTLLSGQQEERHRNHKHQKYPHQKLVLQKIVAKLKSSLCFSEQTAGSGLEVIPSAGWPGAEFWPHSSTFKTLKTTAVVLDNVFESFS